MKTIAKTVTAKYSPHQQFDVTIVPKKSITIECLYLNMHVPKMFKRTFKIGDTVEYDSFNLKYLGQIVSITEKSVIVDTCCGSDSPKKRMTLDEFCCRNYNFDLDAINAHNTEERLYI